MSAQEVSPEEIEYIKKHLLTHLRSLGMSEEAIMSAISSMKEGEIKQYLLTQIS